MANNCCIGRFMHRMLLLGLLAGPAAWANDHPNLEGVWKLVPPQAALKPADGREIPYTPEGRSQFEQNQAAAAKGDYEFDRTESRCSSPGLPRLMLTPMLIKVYQRPRTVAILFEWNRLLRLIDLRQEPKLHNPMRDGGLTGGGDVGTMSGTTSGHWEGNVLVAQSTQFSDQKLLDGLVPNSDELQLTEHIRLKDRDTLEDRITIQDPQYFTRPWDAVLTYKRQPDQLFPFHEDICLERKQAGELPLPR